MSIHSLDSITPPITDSPGPVPQVNKPLFLASLPRLEPVANDHSSMKLAMECMRKYFYRIILGRKPAKSKYQTVFDFGSLYHKFREVLELSYMAGKDEATCLSDAISAVIDKPITPGEGKYSFYTRERLMRTCKVAYEYWKKEKAQKTIEVIAVEQYINMALPDGTFISGRADQIIKWNGKIWGRDFKTTSKEFKYFEATLDPNDQATRYIFMESGLHFGDKAIDNAQLIGGIIFEVIQNKADSEKGNKQGSCEIKAIPISRSLEQMKMWRKEQLFLHRVIQMAKDEDTWMMQPTNCSFCDYAYVCRKQSESAMAYELKTNYQFSPWDPSKVEQEVHAG